MTTVRRDGVRQNQSPFLSVIVWVPQRNRSNGIYYKELAHTIMEAEKPQDLQLVSRRARSTNEWYSSSPSDPTAGEDRCPSSKTSGRKRILSYSTFCSFLVFNQLGEAHAHWEGQSALFSLQIQTLISSRNTLTDTPRNNVSPNVWAPHGPIKLTLKINHHTLTGPQFPQVHWGDWIWCYSILFLVLWMGLGHSVIRQDNNVI